MRRLAGLALVRYRKTFALAAVATMAACVALAILLPNTYESESVMLVGQVRPADVAAGSPESDQVLAGSYAEIARGDSTLTAVGDRLEPPLTASELKAQTSVEAIPQTSLIRIVATSSDPSRSASIANLYAESFVQRNRESVIAEGRPALSAAKGALSRQSRTVAALRLEGSSEMLAAETRLEALKQTYQTLLEDLAQRSGTIGVSVRADTPSAPAGPPRRLILFAGLFLALAAAMGAVYIRSLFDHRVENEQELVELSGYPVLARVPWALFPGDPVAEEAFRFLGSNLMARVQAGSNRRLAVVVTSANAGEGKTAIAAGLGRALAQAGQRVLLVDADLRRPRLAQELGVHTKGGLLDAVLGRQSLSDSIDDVAPGLSLLAPASASQGAPESLFNVSALERLTEYTKSGSDFVIFDTPPVAGGAETSTVARIADGVLFVADLSTLKRDEYSGAIKQLATAGATVLGVALNRSRVSSTYYYYNSAEMHAKDQVSAEPTPSNAH